MKDVIYFNWKFFSQLKKKQRQLKLWIITLNDSDVPKCVAIFTVLASKFCAISYNISEILISLHLLSIGFCCMLSCKISIRDWIICLAFFSCFSKIFNYINLKWFWRAGAPCDCFLGLSLHFRQSKQLGWCSAVMGLREWMHSRWSLWCAAWTAWIHILSITAVIVKLNINCCYCNQLKY